MRNIAIIPARGGSKRLPGKNLLDLGGLPLIAHSILYAKANPHIISDIYVTTDDEKIRECALEYGVKVIDRPAILSGDTEPTVTALKHVLENCGERFDNVILLQPTNPLRPESLLKECIVTFLGHKTDSLFTVTQNHHKLGKISEDRFIPYNYEPGQRSQDMEPLYFENGLLYIVSSELIMREKIMSENAFPFLMNHVFSNVDIDTAEDLAYAAYLFENSKITKST